MIIKKSFVHQDLTQQLEHPAVKEASLGIETTNNLSMWFVLEKFKSVT
jgi:hypothetical protein